MAAYNTTQNESLTDEQLFAVEELQQSLAILKVLSATDIDRLDQQAFCGVVLAVSQKISNAIASI